MKWNEETGRLTYIRAMKNLKTTLGIATIDHPQREVFIPYVTYILDYVSNRLLSMESDEPIRIKDYIEEVFQIYDEGEEYIAGSETLTLVSKVGISTEQDYVECEEIPYDQEHFVYSWASTMTALVVRLKIQYASLFNQSEKDCSSDCGCCSNNPTKEYENWHSGVYPEDDLYDYSYETGHAVSWRIGVDSVECTKCSRQPKH